jgi:cerato-platanin
MILLTTFILTLLLARISRAEPACGDVASPEELYDPTYDDVQKPVPPIIIVFNVTWDIKYDNPNCDTHNLTCSNLAYRYPHCKNLPHYPYIGAAYDVKKGTPSCGKCWKLTNIKNKRSISFTAVDYTKSGFDISKHAYNDLSGGLVGSHTLRAEATPVPPSVCGFR